MLNNIEILITEEEINEKVNEIANAISKDFENEEIILVCVLKGAIYFTIDLSKKIKNSNVILDFVKVSSYGIGDRESSGKIEFSLGITENVENRNVIIIEDIVDSGLTLSYLYNYFKVKNPKTLKICALLDKYERRTIDVNVDYVGFKIEDKYVIGYGMDYDEKYRNLPYVAYVK